MIENGYKVRQESDGTWTVVEAYRDQPVEYKGKLQTGLTETEANDCLVQVTRTYMERQHEGGSGNLP